MFPRKAALQVVTDVYAAFGAGDLNQFRLLLDPAVELHQAASLPYGGTYRGIAEVMNAVGQVMTVWEQPQLQIRQMIADGDAVIVLLEFKARPRGSNKILEFPVAELWRVRDEKVVEVRPFYYDTHAIHVALVAEDFRRG
jgi:uncharacterized protein